MPKLRKIVETVLSGIDKCEIDSHNGWWETDEGAKFGAEKKEELILELEKRIKCQN